MANRILIVALLLVATLSSCKKDLATDWVGTYNGTAGGNVNRVVITKVSDNTIKMELQTVFLGVYTTFATVGNGKLSNSTTVGVDEDGSLATNQGAVYHFTGTGTRNGNSLALSGIAVNKSNSNDTQAYSFSGSK